MSYLQTIQINDSKVSTVRGKPGSNNQSHFFQPKLSINQPNDKYEQEADIMAEKVMGKSNNENFFFKPRAPLVQRKCAHCEEEEQLQRKENSSQEPASDNVTSFYIDSLSSKGSSLTEKERSFFEPRFGYDFSNVKIHNDNAAAESAQAVNALAYTSGNHIVFNQNQFSPETNGGRNLLAHELTHVVQQNSSQSATNNIQRQDNKSEDEKLPLNKKVELEAPKDDLPSVIASPENKEAEKAHLGFDFSKSISANPPKYPMPDTYAFSLVYRDANLKSFGDDDAFFAVDIGHEPNFQLTLSPDPHNAQIYQAAFTLMNFHFRRHKQEFIELGISPLVAYSQPSGGLAGGAQAQIEWHVTSKFSITASSVINASKHDDKAPIDYSSVSLGTAKGLDWSWSPVSVGMVWHFDQ